VEQVARLDAPVLRLDQIVPVPGEVKVDQIDGLPGQFEFDVLAVLGPLAGDEQVDGRPLARPAPDEVPIDVDAGKVREPDRAHDLDLDGHGGPDENGGTPGIAVGLSRLLEQPERKQQQFTHLPGVLEDGQAPPVLLGHAEADIAPGDATKAAGKPLGEGAIFEMVERDRPQRDQHAHDLPVRRQGVTLGEEVDDPADVLAGSQHADVGQFGDGHPAVDDGGGHLPELELAQRQRAGFQPTRGSIIHLRRIA
jgi:hypothetical protein